MLCYRFFVFSSHGICPKSQFSLTPEIIEKVKEFHGHSCPGSYMGLRAAEWAMREFKTNDREKIIVVAEVPFCGVDSLQVILGITTGFRYRCPNRHPRTADAGFDFDRISRRPHFPPDAFEKEGYLMLTVDGLSFRYGKSRILDNVTFEVVNGTMLSVLGPNGSDKTTLIRCINAILKPQVGKILLNNERIDLLSTEKMARQIAYMPQRTETSGLTVFDAVLLGRKPYMNWKPAAEDYEKVEQTLLRLELRDKALRPIDRLGARGGVFERTCFIEKPCFLGKEIVA